MNKTRLEAFSDGVIAIIITIMVLEIKMPHSAEWKALQDLLPAFLSYIISFAFIGIYWNNHHHMLHTVQHLTPGIMWSNLNLLFWLSLIPFATAWMGENSFERNPVIFYAAILFLCGFSYDILRRAIVRSYKGDHVLKQALEKEKLKGLISTFSYLAAIPFAYVHTAISCGLFVLVAVMWFIPSKAIEAGLHE
jgi:uncharacterized membrane protein